MEPRSGCLVDKVIVVKSVGQEMLVKVNINVLQRVLIRSCSCPSHSWEDEIQVDRSFEDSAFKDLGY